MTRLSLATVLAAALAAPPAFGQSDAIEQQILPPGSAVAGKPIGEWTGKWWSWLLTAPLHRDPALDEAGDHCGIDQDGPIWFLAGSFSEYPVTRRCNVPEGKHLLLPMRTGIVKPIPSQTEATCATSREKASRFADAVLGLYASVNGVPVAAPERFREHTTACFDPNGSGRAISAQDGYWIMLRPLPPGRHILRFGHNEAGGKQNTNVAYILQVGGEASPRVVEPKPNEALPFAHQMQRSSGAPSPAREKDASGEPTHEDFPRFSHAAFKPRPGFELRDFLQRLWAIILREGKYKRVFQKRLVAGALTDVRFTWPDVKERYAASENLKTMMPHPMTVWITREENRILSVNVGAVNPNRGSSFALRAEIVTDAARMVNLALDRRVPVSDEERLRGLQHKPPDFAEVAGGDPWAEIMARSEQRREEALDREAESRPPSEDDKRQFTAGDLSAAGGELHAIGVRQGPKPSGAPGSRSRITVTVLPFTARPIVLLLTAHDAVEWHVVSVGARISKIIALGGHRQTIANAPADAQRVSRSLQDGFEGAFFSHGKDAEDVKQFFERAKALTGGSPATFQARQAASNFIVDGDAQVRIEGKRVSMPLPAPARTVLGNPGDVRFEAPAHVAHVAPDGLTFTSCLPGAPLAVKTNRSHIRGKVYFELTLKARPRTLHPGANVGLALAAAPGTSMLVSPKDVSTQHGIGVLEWGGAPSYQSGDVFGVAADLDEGRLHFHVNGEWKGGAPGSGGVAIAVGRAYAAAASIGTNSKEQALGCNGWSGNFGKTPFKYGPPPGFKSYDGTR